MTDYGQFCPVAKAAEVFAERWTPLIIRELLCGSRRYSEIRNGVPLMSPSLLSNRLQELERSGIVERRTGPGRTSEYHLTEAGEQLRPVVMLLGEWGQRWSRGRMRPADYDPSLLVWDIRRRVRHSALPPNRIVLHFHFRDVPVGKGHYWMVLQAGEADVCLNDPGFDVDVEVSCPIRVMVEAWMGEIDLSEAVRAGDIELQGRRAYVRSFPRWFELSLFAPTAPNRTRLAKPPATHLPANRETAP